jgi:hypothetical protein
MGVRGLSWRLPPARRGNHSTVKDALPPRPPTPTRVIRKEMCSTLGKSRPLLHPLQSVRLTSARQSGGQVFEEAKGFIQVYSVEREEEGLQCLLNHATA